MLNCVTLMGRLVADPELRTTTTGKSVATFRIAVDRSFVRQGEQRQADFITIVAWESTANFVCRYFQKGSMISVVGNLQSRSWENQEGKKQYATDVVVDEVYFTGSRTESHTQGDGGFSTQSNDSAFADIDTMGFQAIDGSEDDLPF